MLSAACSHPRQAILVTIDTLRADHVDSRLTPSLLALSRDAVTFSDAVANATTTLPSHVAMLSGVLPWRQGVTENQGRMDSSSVTLAGLLHRQGFATAAVVSSFPLRGELSGLNEGFDLYHESFDSSEGNRKGQLVKTPEETTRVALEWVRAHHSEDFFLWVHYFPPHGPYIVPERFLDPGEEPSGEILPVSEANYEPGAIPAYQRLDIEPDAGRYRSRYAGHVRHVDAEVGRLLGGLRTLGIYDHATLIVTSDHGESLGEHNHFFCHGDLVYDEQARIPFFLKLGGRERAGSVVASPIEGVDVAPTILQALGIDIPAGLDGHSLIGAAPAPHPRFTASTGAEVVSVREEGWMFSLRLGPPRLLPENHPLRELFSPQGDPRALKNLVDTESTLAATLEKVVRRQFTSVPESRAVSPEVEERLRTLGYIR